MAHKNGSAQSNKLGHKSGKSKPLFLLPTGYLTQIQNEPAHSKEKSPKQRGVTFWLCTPERLALLHGAGRLPNVKSLLQLQELAQPGLLQGTLKERSSRKWSQQLLGPYLKIPRWGLAGHELWFLWLASPKFVRESKIILLSAQRANKLRDELLGQKRAILFGKPAAWENVSVTKPPSPKLEDRLHLYSKGRGWSPSSCQEGIC